MVSWSSVWSGCKVRPRSSAAWNIFEAVELSVSTRSARLVPRWSTGWIGSEADVDCYRMQQSGSVAVSERAHAPGKVAEEFLHGVLAQWMRVVGGQ